MKMLMLSGILLSFGAHSASANLGNISQSLSISLKGPQSAKLYDAFKKDAECDDVPNGNGTTYRLCKASLAWSTDDGNPFPKDTSLVNLTCSQVNNKAPECSLGISVQK
jgi:hypothetical protein